MSFNDVRQTRKYSDLWLWSLIAWLSIMLLLSILKIEIVYTIIAGTLGLIAFAQNQLSQIRKSHRNRHPWELTFPVVRIGDTEQHGIRHKSLQIKPGLYTIQVELRAKVLTILSSQATIATGLEPMTFSDAVRTRIKRRQFKPSLTSINAAKKLLLHQYSFDNPPPNCPLQIKKVEDETPGREEHGTQFAPRKGKQPGSGTSMWWLHYNPPFEVGTGRFIVLNIEIEATAPWKGYIGFSSQIEGQVRRVYRKVEVKGLGYGTTKS